MDSPWKLIFVLSKGAMAVFANAPKNTLVNRERRVRHPKKGAPAIAPEAREWKTEVNVRVEVEPSPDTDA